MGRTADYSRERCSIAGALEVVGDPWTLLILRDAFRGARRFEQWQEGLGVARNVLAARLKTLVGFGLLEAKQYSERPPRQEYVLTEKGRDLAPVLLTLAAWGDKHIYSPDAAPTHFQHIACGHRFTPQLACAACGEAVTVGGLALLESPPVPTVGEALEAASAQADIIAAE